MSKVLNTIDEEPKMADEFQQDTESNRMGGDIHVQVSCTGDVCVCTCMYISILMYAHVCVGYLIF